MHKTVFSYALCATAFLSQNAWPLTDTIFMQHTYLGYEILDRPTLLKSDSMTLLATRDDRLKTYSRYKNILNMIGSEDVAIDDLEFEELQLTNQSIIDEIFSITAATNRILFEIRQIAAQKEAKQDLGPDAFLQIINATLTHQGSSCSTTAPLIQLRLGDFAVIRFNCETIDGSMIEAFGSVSLDMSDRIHVNDQIYNKDTLESSNETLLTTVESEYSGSSISLQINYSVEFL